MWCTYVTCLYLNLHRFSSINIHRYRKNIKSVKYRSRTQKIQCQHRNIFTARFLCIFAFKRCVSFNVIFIFLVKLEISQVPWPHFSYMFNFFPTKITQKLLSITHLSFERTKHYVYSDLLLHAICFNRSILLVSKCRQICKLIFQTLLYNTIFFQPNGLLYESFGVFCPSDALEDLRLLYEEDVLIDWTRPIYLNFTHGMIMKRIEQFYTENIGTVDKMLGDFYCLEDMPEDDGLEGYILSLPINSLEFIM